MVGSMKPPLVAHLLPYPLGDSLAGPSLALAQGSAAIDANVLTCKATFPTPWRPRRIVVTHWSQWWKHGFEPKPGTKVPHKPIEQLTLKQVQDLRSTFGHDEIPTAEAYVMRAAQVGVIPILEMKPSVWTPKVLSNLLAFSRKHRVPVAMSTVQRYGDSRHEEDQWEEKAHDRMAVAKAVGHITVLYARLPVSKARWTPVLFGVKNVPAWNHDGKHVANIRQTVHYLQEMYR